MGRNPIISWNCRGIKPNLPEVQLLIKDNNPVAICLQETYLKNCDHLPTFTNYSGYHRFAKQQNDKATGGTSIYVRNDVPHKEISLPTSLDVLAVSLNGHKNITLCSVYLPPSERVEKAQLQDIFNHLPSPCLLLGDFNAHNTMWRSRSTNNKGKIMEDFIVGNGLTILNDHSQTYVSPATGTTSILDLAICHPSLYLDYDFKVAQDLHGSDHYPIFLQPVSAPAADNPARWKLHKADWTRFETLCSQNLLYGNFVF